jgi:hypothetical protein
LEPWIYLAGTSVLGVSQWIHYPIVDVAKQLCFPSVAAPVNDYAEVADFHGVVMSLSVFAVLRFLSAISPVLLAKPPMCEKIVFISF